MNLSAKTGAVESCLFLEKKMEAVSNNIANMGTSSFKKACTSFREVLAKCSDGSIRSGTTMILGTDFSPGEMKQTGNPLDVALQGPGFFKVETPQGVVYTRNGSFTQNNEGILVTSDGYPVLGQGGQITLKGSNIEINDHGGISMDQSGDGRMSEIDRLTVVNFEDTSVLEKVGDSSYRSKSTSAQETPADDTKVQQGFLEQSNINPVQEMIDLIQIQRTYEFYRKVIQSYDELESRLYNDVGRLS